MRELHLTRKDFTLTWFSGTGAGGQHRNKTQNCCRITHNETGLSAVGQRGRDRQTNQREAFKVLVSRIVAHYEALDNKRPAISDEVIRNYHEPRNEVLDKVSGLRREYRDVVVRGDLSEMIRARRSALRG